MPTIPKIDRTAKMVDTFFSIFLMAFPLTNARLFIQQTTHRPTRTSSAPPEEHVADAHKAHFQPTKTQQSFLSVSTSPFPFSFFNPFISNRSFYFVMHSQMTRTGDLTNTTKPPAGPQRTILETTVPSLTLRQAPDQMAQPVVSQDPVLMTMPRLLRTVLQHTQVLLSRPRDSRLLLRCTYRPVRPFAHTLRWRLCPPPCARPAETTAVFIRTRRAKTVQLTRTTQATVTFATAQTLARTAATGRPTTKDKTDLQETTTTITT